MEKKEKKNKEEKKTKEEDIEKEEKKENDFELNVDISKLPISEIAIPMSSEKMNGKLLSLIKKLANIRLIRRGVKEVNKHFRNYNKNSEKKKKDKQACFCVIAGDVSPIDVISHIPVLCEKNNIPYIYVPSRQLLGAASQTKRPTSVVMVLEPPEDNKYKDKFDKLKSVVEKYLDEGK